MTRSTDCPLCNDTYETETNLRVHLEVEHRKSELAVFIVDDEEASGDPTVERERPTPAQ
ncbi:hypothetical protein OB955_24115 [Halobacteria archaeon AArc-m2/3/4]|uniref:C2H2-type domain-containing protein n=1 Tax=Natronoglomus mannanivorans TaxID=2979990 RepID=A0AAP3E1W8_9EURY|nr:hypothetical protein [Halobacteria archaeon AArc-xg1-1]MCU4975772.1 hypothetical protein [Halobacteria archaeon AArc-m2/3/4]